MAVKEETTCLIVGASHAGAQAALRLRRLNWQGPITLVGEERRLPYHRPPLSKDYLKGSKSFANVLLNPEEAYRKAEVELQLGVRAEQIDKEAKTLRTSDGLLHYDKLILAVGSRPRVLPIPGNDLAGVLYLRSADDVDQIREAVKPGGKAVVVGGGYIGLEAAASLRALGMEVVVLEALERVLQRVTGEIVSNFFTRVHEEEGVAIRVGAGVSEFVGEDKVSAVRLPNGEEIAADLVVVGIGIVPNLELASDAGLKTGDGIEVNQYAQTNDPDIYAVGDCASFVHPRYQRRLRLESVQNANDQATTAAKSICGQAEPYDALPWFWSDQYDVKLQIAGLAQGADQTIVRGDPGTGRSLSIIYLENGRLLAVDAINNPRDFVFGKKLIVEEKELDAEKLADPEIPLTGAAVS